MIIIIPDVDKIKSAEFQLSSIDFPPTTGQMEVLLLKLHYVQLLQTNSNY